MAAFDDLKEQLREQLQGLAGQIQESSAWNQLMEKYQDLSPTMQKVALAGVSFIFALVLLMVPYSFFSSSQTYMEEFENQKQLMRDLYRASRAANAIPPLPPPVSASDLRMAVDGILSSETPQLQPEQRGAIADYTNTKASAVLPKSLQQAGVSVNLTKLNLDQIVRIGSRLQSVRPTAKLVGLRIQATAADPHYFDVTYRIVAFSAPPEPVAKGPARPGTKAPPRPSADDDE